MFSSVSRFMAAKSTFEMLSRVYQCSVLFVPLNAMMITQECILKFANYKVQVEIIQVKRISPGAPSFAAAGLVVRLDVEG